MKTSLRILLNARLHPLWFILACLLLASVLVGARVLAVKVSRAMDVTLERITQPPPTLPPAKPSGTLLPVALDSPN